MASSTVAAPVRIAEAFLRAAGRADDDAVRRIVLGCRQNSPDATGDEIALLVDAVGQRIAGVNTSAERARRPDLTIVNTVGFLISEVPKLCEPHALAASREKWAQEAGKALQERDRRRKEIMGQVEARKAVLEAPNVDRWEKQYAEEFLAIYEEQRRMLTDPSVSIEQLRVAKDYLGEA